MRQKLRQETGPPSTGQHLSGATPRERRGDLLGAEPGPGPSRSQRPAIQRVQVLVGLANHAGPDGTGAFPSVATLVRYTGLSERTVRTCLDRLEAEGIISPCDPDIIAARIKRADRRPQGWDMNLSLVRDDLDDAAVAVLEHQFPGLGVRLAAAAQPGADGQSDGCNWRSHGVQRLHPNRTRNRPGDPPPSCARRRTLPGRL